MAFKSILFKTPIEVAEMMPECFVNLNLDQVINELCAGREEYNLKPFYFTHLTNKEDITYRQQVFKDMENAPVMESIEKFADSMRQIRSAFIFYEKCDDAIQKNRLFLDMVVQYCDSVNLMKKELSGCVIQSEGFSAFIVYLKNNVNSKTFNELATEIKELNEGLSAVRYKIVINELRVQVLPYLSEPDYREEIEKAFYKFKQNPLKDYRIQFEEEKRMNHVESAILKGVATLYPALFEKLNTFNTEHINFRDETIVTFDRDIQFYIAWLQYISLMKEEKLPFSYPEILETSKEVCNQNSFDIALASKLVKEKKQIITNDFYLKDNERIIVVTGPNQGGKTTFARTFGQLHYLGCIGCCIPGTTPKIFLYDYLLTHFEKEEQVETHLSKFEEDLIRIHEMLNKATSKSILILNEIFSSTTLQDALFLNKKIMQTTDRLDMLCVWVTFIDELIGLSKKTVSMLSTIEPENPAVRTFKIIRNPANGMAYALSIAEKYGVTYNLLKQRLER